MHHYRELYAMYDDHAGEVQNSEKRWTELRDLGGNVRSAERAALKSIDLVGTTYDLDAARRGSLRGAWHRLHHLGGPG